MLSHHAAANCSDILAEIERLRADRADLEGKAAALAAGVYAEWGLDTMRCVTVLVQDECWRKGREVERLTAELAAAQTVAAGLAERPRRWKCGAGPTEPSGG